MITKTAQFTPGPWNVRHYRVAPTNCQWSDVTDSTGGLITHVPSSKGNAALIAAAPAMYAELVNGLGLLEASYHDMCDKYGNDSLQAQTVWEQVERTRNVIAQAEGRHHE